MNDLVLHCSALPKLTADQINRISDFEKLSLEQPQVDIPTHHMLHAGMYARSIVLRAGVILTGALIKIATILIIDGHLKACIGDDVIEFEGYHVLPGSAGRKQVFYAITDTNMAMLFPTKAKTVEEAEREFTDDAERLMSRNSKNNHIIITGE